jgi:hypothetical protein
MICSFLNEIQNEPRLKPKLALEGINMPDVWSFAAGPQRFVERQDKSSLGCVK